MAEEKKLSLPEAENFIEREINRDLSEGVYAQVCTRFPPEPQRIHAYRPYQGHLH